MYDYFSKKNTGAYDYADESRLHLYPYSENDEFTRPRSKSTGFVEYSHRQRNFSDFKSPETGRNLKLSSKASFDSPIMVVTGNSSSVIDCKKLVNNFAEVVDSPKLKTLLASTFLLFLGIFLIMCYFHQDHPHDVYMRNHRNYQMSKNRFRSSEGPDEARNAIREALIDKGFTSKNLNIPMSYTKVIHRKKVPVVLGNDDGENLPFFSDAKNKPLKQQSASDKESMSGEDLLQTNLIKPNAAENEYVFQEGPSSFGGDPRFPDVTNRTPDPYTTLASSHDQLDPEPFTERPELYDETSARHLSLNRKTKRSVLTKPPSIDSNFIEYVDEDFDPNLHTVPTSNQQDGESGDSRRRSNKRSSTFMKKNSNLKRSPPGVNPRIYKGSHDL